MNTRERPTAAVRHVDVSEPGSGTSAARHDLIVSACSWCGTFPCSCIGPRTEPCACGGFITASLAEHAVMAAVQAHNATRRHLWWRERRLGQRAA